MKPIRVSSTILSEFSFCRQYALYKMNGFVKRSGSLPLMYGSIVHDVIARIYRSHWLEGDPEWFNERVCRSVEHALRMIEKSTGDADTHAKLHEASYEIKALLIQYFKHWSEDEEQGEYVAMEHKFEVRYTLEGQPFIIDGILDGVMLRKDGLWIIEHKSSAKIREQLLYLRAMVSFQNRLYLYFNRGRYVNPWGQPIKGVLYDVIRKPSLRIRKGKGKNKIGAESFEEFQARVHQDIFCDPEHYFHRLPMEFTAGEFMFFNTQLREKLLSYAQWLKGESPTYGNDSGYSCAGGMQACEYLDACATPGPISRNPLYHYERSKRRCPYIPSPISRALSQHYSL